MAAASGGAVQRRVESLKSRAIGAGACRSTSGASSSRSGPGWCRWAAFEFLGEAADGGEHVADPGELFVEAFHLPPLTYGERGVRQRGLRV